MLSTSLVHQNGAARPVGGMGGLVDALERCLRAHGGDVSLGTAAVAIHPRSGCAGTVELEDGRLAHAGRAVIAACPPQLVPDLAAELDAAVAERLRSAPANATGVGALTVNLALVGRLELPAHQAHRADFDLRRPTLFHGSFADVIGACEQCARGRLPDTANWCLAILTAIDPSQAPEGQDVAQLYAPAPVAPDGGWAAQRVNAAARLVAAVGVAAPALTELEIGRYVETPSDLSDRTGTINGCLYHVDHLPTRMGPLRPAFGAGGYRTPLPGLYLGSAGSHPGGGVSGLPGKLCALTVLADGRSRSGVRSLWRAPVRHSQKPVTRDSQPRTVPVADNHARHPGDGLATSPH
jgi:phytoene dehydrogenase-like protein